MIRRTDDILKVEDIYLFLSHYTNLSKIAAKSGEFDAVFIGHSHIKSETKINDCLIVNPGELAAYGTIIASFVIYNTNNNSIDFIEIPDTLTTKTEMSDKAISKSREIIN